MLVVLLRFEFRCLVLKIMFILNGRIKEYYYYEKEFLGFILNIIWKFRNYLERI